MNTNRTIKINNSNETTRPLQEDFACIDCPFSNWKFGKSSQDILIQKEQFFREEWTKEKEKIMNDPLRLVKINGEFDLFFKNICETNRDRNDEFNNFLQKEIKKYFWKSEENQNKFSEILKGKNNSAVSCYCTKEFQYTFTTKNSSDYFHITQCDFKDDVLQQASNNLPE